MLCPRRELTKKGRDVAEASNGETYAEVAMQSKGRETAVVRVDARGS